jgi:threonine synthase
LAMASTLTHLECSRCKKTYPENQLINLCSCGGPLLGRYDLARAAKTLTRAALASRAPTMWRYAELLPAKGEPVSLGEGMTPLVHARRLGAEMGLRRLYVKDEGLNPTGSFKARGLSAAVTRAKELGAKKLATPTAGNAGGALAAYAARAGLPAVIVMPADTPEANEIECRAAGAEVVKLDGLISDCGKYVAERKDHEGWYEVTTLKEPYRIEGKKTMGFEAWEQLGGELPDVIIYPTGGGVGMIGMWKAFAELEALGLAGAKRPRMVTVQAAGCAPIVRAFEQGAESGEFWQNAATIASGLRVPKAIGDFLILQAIRESGGTALAVTDEEIMIEAKQLAAVEGIFAAPEGAASLIAARKLAKQGWIWPEEVVVAYNTGSGYKYLPSWRQAVGI